VRIVFGIGNPGPKYDGTRHNLGFDVVDAIAAEAGADLVPIRGLEAEGARVTLRGTPLLLVKPLTYVNRCGPVLAAARDALGAPLEHLLVVVDDLALDVGRLRLRPRGSDGGHNGLKSIAARLGSQAFWRLRCGIGAPGAADSVTDHVLGRFPEAQGPVVDAAVGRAVEAVKLWALHAGDRAMAEVNRRS
jgi:PTH1 family peptidyl-tRNA hydrolase